MADYLNVTDSFSNPFALDVVHAYWPFPRALQRFCRESRCIQGL